MDDTTAAGAAAGAVADVNVEPISSGVMYEMECPMDVDGNEQMNVPDGATTTTAFDADAAAAAASIEHVAAGDTTAVAVAAVDGDGDGGDVGKCEDDDNVNIKPKFAYLHGGRGSTHEAAIRHNPWDVDAWRALVGEAQKMRSGILRGIYERCITQFPTSGKFWRMYAEFELRLNNFARAEALFKRCLMSVTQQDLHRRYINYLSETKRDLPTRQKVLEDAFEFSVGFVGFDMRAAGLWTSYIDLLKARPVVGQFEEGQLLDAVRRVYKRAVVQPMRGVEKVWNDYNQYENNLNRLTAKKILGEVSPRYMTARRVLREREARMSSLKLDALATPPLGTAADRTQVKAWMAYIEWEQSNPLGLDQGDLRKRLCFCYRQSLCYLRLHGVMWSEYAQYLSSAGQANEASAVFMEASTVLPYNLPLHFAWADFEESRNNISEVKAMYNRLVAVVKVPKVDSEPTEASNCEGEKEENGEQDVEASTTELDAVEAPTEEAIVNGLDTSGVSLVYIKFMQFCRRAEGSATARAVFKRARFDSRCTYHVFIAAALMEYYVTQDAMVAVRIFEVGLNKKGYIENPAYVLHYIDFLSHLNSHNNTRSLFERVLTRLPPQRAGDVWRRFLKFESEYGDHKTALNVERKLIAAAPGASTIGEHSIVSVGSALERYRYMDLLPCSAAELSSLGALDALVATDSTPSGNQEGPIGPEDDWVPPAYVSTSDTATVALEEEKERRNEEILRRGLRVPDVLSMVRYNPISNKVFSASGGAVNSEDHLLPIPEPVSQLLSFLPPPSCFKARIRLDEVVDLILKTSVSPVRLPPPPPQPTNIPLFKQEPTVPVAAPSSKATNIAGTKREHIKVENSDTAPAVPQPPVKKQAIKKPAVFIPPPVSGSDLFRERTQRRFKDNDTLAQL